MSGYPSAEEEKEIVTRTTGPENVKLKKILNKEELLKIQELVMSLPVAEHIVDYAVSMVRSTRPGNTEIELVKKYVKWGAGPRASQYLIIGAKTRAALLGKMTPDEDDINAVADLVLPHRILRNFKAEADGIKLENIISELTKG